MDTREQRPFDFESMAVVRRALRFGDYSLVGHTGRVCVERKSFDDLFGTFTGRRSRIERQLARMGEMDVAALIVEAPMSRVAMGHPRTRVDGRRLLGSVLLACARAGVAPIFCDGREEAREACELLLVSYFRNRTGRAGMQ